MKSLTELRRQLSFSKTMHSRKQEKYSAELAKQQAHIDHLAAQVAELEKAEAS